MYIDEDKKNLYFKQHYELFAVMLLFAMYQFDFSLELEFDDVLFDFYWIEWVFDIFAKYLLDSVH
jgi:hypothetical protein